MDRFILFHKNLSLLFKMDWRDYIQVTQYITSIGLNYKKKGFYLEGV